MSTYEIHPRIGVARLGNSPTDFYLAPETIGGLPIQCDASGNPVITDGAPTPVSKFKDDVGRIKRQAAKFRIFRRDDNGTVIEVGLTSDDIQSITWAVHIANKKPIWYTFSELIGDPEFGPDNSYEGNHVPVNNPTITDPAARQALIIDPGPRSVSDPGTVVEFSRYNIPGDYAHGSFPPVSAGGRQIDVLGELRMDDAGNLIALGGFGAVTGSGSITSFRGAAGYWDDIADGYVVAELTLADGTKVTADTAWLIVGSPKYVPEVVNIITLADTMEDVSIRAMGARPDMYTAGADTGANFAPAGGYTPLGGFNPDYVVNFARDVAPIIDRPRAYRWVANVPTMVEFSSPPFDVRDASAENAANRRRYFDFHRVPLLPQDYADQYATMVNGPATLFSNDGLPLMPLNSGDNSVTNHGPIYKFLSLTPTQYFYLFQWAAGKFTNDCAPDMPITDTLDRVDAGNCVGGPFSPGIEVTWSIRNAPVYAKPLQFALAHYDDGIAGLANWYRSNGLSTTANETIGGGCEPGDMTKRMAIPWMADFQECTVQTPNINNIHINQMEDGSGIEVPPAYYVYWWPAQSPFNVMTGALGPGDQVLDAVVSGIDGQPVIPAGQNVEFQRGIDGAADMIAHWAAMGFVVNTGPADYPNLVETERNFGELAQAKLNAG